MDEEVVENEEGTFRLETDETEARTYERTDTSEPWTLTGTLERRTGAAA